MRIVIDLDGTISPLKKDGDSYADLVPFPGAVDRLKAWKAEGHYIIVQTARNMGTQESNLGKVMKNVGKVTLDWLDRYEVPYDEVYFGKPNGQIYIDDRAFRFQDWKEMDSLSLEKWGKEK